MQKWWGAFGLHGYIFNRSIFFGPYGLTNVISLWAIRGLVILVKIVAFYWAHYVLCLLVAHPYLGRWGCVLGFNFWATILGADGLYYWVHYGLLLF